MHILLDLAALLLVVLGGGMLLLHQLPELGNWSQRRVFHLLVLLLPLVSLALIGGGLVHVTAFLCLQRDPWWDHVLDSALLIAFAVTLLGALMLGGLRLIFMKRLMQQREVLVNPDLQARVDSWTQRRGMNPVRIRLCLDAQPLALIYGIRRPTALLSTWMLEHLDEAELEAVLTHELVHVSRHDYVVNWIATLLRDAFFYLPTSRSAYQQLRREKELACDDLVVEATRRPLALASALTKVWLHLIDRPHSSGTALLAQQLIRGDEQITGRVDRLLTSESHTCEKTSASSLGGGVSLGIPLVVLAASMVCMIAEITCWPGPWF